MGTQWVLSEKFATMREITYRDYATLKRGDIVEFDDGSQYTVIDSTQLEDGGLVVLFNQARLFVSSRQTVFKPFKIVGYHKLQPIREL